MADLIPPNAAESTLSAQLLSGGTSLSVQTGDGAKFSSPTGGDVGRVVIKRASDGKREILSFSGRSTDSLTGLSRHVEAVGGDSTAYQFEIGDTIAEVHTHAAQGSQTATKDHSHTATGDGGVLVDDKHDGYILAKEIATPSNPPSGYLLAYPKSDDAWYMKDSSGNERKFASAGLTANVTYNNNYASPPSSPNAGDLWIPSDSPEYIGRYNGSAWIWSLAPLGLVTPPASQSWSGNNLGTSTLANRGASTTLAVPAQAAENWRSALVSVSAPYTIVCVVTCTGTISTSSRYAFILLRESSSGKLLHLGIDAAGSTEAFKAYKWTNDTTFSADYGPSTWVVPKWPTYYVKFVDDGTHRFFYSSMDGINWGPNMFGTLGNTDFLTPNQAGFGMSFTGNIGPNTMLVRHYSIT